MSQMALIKGTCDDNTPSCVVSWTAFHLHKCLLNVDVCTCTHIKYIFNILNTHTGSYICLYCIYQDVL